ncbi:TetR/AcrR family transcriptional regulator [Parahaliea maris]|uniref:TetR/AcrR family transcriptional regulator n=1 Tax=Parahaliea maris TaxID=2716870 RepID=UPI00164F6EB4|nr:TetR/AcrR family transcriptional regulator [Parahaliea maris]
MKARTKGQQTTDRILNAAEPLFAAQGYEATSLRMIASAVGIRVPGIYNHFENKRALYRAMLDRALMPMENAMREHLEHPDSGQAFASLPAVMTELLAEHPAMPALFLQALQGRDDGEGGAIMTEWLQKLFASGMETTKSLGGTRLSREDMALRIIAMFNLCCGYFLCQSAFASMVGDQHKLDDDSILKKQKQLLARVQLAIMLD